MTQPEKERPYYVVMERPRHAKHERAVWGNACKEAAEDDAKARAKHWGRLSVYRVATFVELDDMPKREEKP